MAKQENYNDDDKVLAYDLRQAYAQIVSEHMEDISNARKVDNYYCWFKSLEDLHTMVRFKFKNHDKDEEEYKKLKKFIITVANNHQTTWKGDSKDSEEMMAIEKVLRELEEFLYIKMNDNNMFGSRFGDDEGL